MIIPLSLSASLSSLLFSSSLSRVFSIKARRKMSKQGNEIRSFGKQVFFSQQEGLMSSPLERKAKVPEMFSSIIETGKRERETRQDLFKQCF